MTVDEAIQAASSLLDQRGQLLNGHLLRLVDGDKELFRAVRERLIQEGIAEDRSGVGLARVESLANALRREELSSFTGGHLSAAGRAPVAQSPADDWWLMKAGTIRGPLELEVLCELGRKGEIETADVVRHGSRGLWRQPDSVPEIAASRRGQGFHRLESSGKPILKSSASSRMADLRKESPSNQDTAAPKQIFVPPEKVWSIGPIAQTDYLRRGWNALAGCVGGADRLIGILLVAGLAAGCYYWWNLPPSNEIIFREFTSCRNAMQKLRDRRVGHEDWAEMEGTYRARIESIVNRLKPYANSRHPVENSLYLAGKLGLLPMMEHSADSVYPEQAFHKHMTEAKREK